MTEIAPPRGWAGLGLGELWAARELLGFLVWRDVRVRYKQTALGAGWAVLQPALTMGVFTLLFGRLAGIRPDGDVPYPLFSYAGLLPWTFLAAGVGRAAGSVVGAANLIQRTAFPRLILPLAAVAAPAVDLAVAALLLIGLLPLYGALPGWGLLALPPLAALVAAAALGPALWLAALSVRYRDVHHLVPFGLQLWLFVSPVIYPASLVTRALEARGLPGWLYGLNPAAGALEGCRWALLGAPAPDPALLGLGAAVSLGLVVSGAVVFRRFERHFADLA